jgi:putative PEP-CTERM system TPR-repeat lipoprotein
MVQQLVRVILGAILIVVFLGGCNQQSTEEYLARGDQFAKAGDWASAIIEFKNSVKQEPENALARAKLGQAYVEIANADAAIKELNRAKEYGYSQDLLLLPLAKAYRQKGDFDRILQETTVQDNYPPELRADLLAFRGVASLIKGDKPAALETLKKARQLNQDRTEVRLAWATLEKTNNNPEAQRSWLAPLLERSGGIADAWTQLGEIEQQANNLEAAEQAYTRSIELRPYGHVDSIRRAVVRIAQGNLDGAQDDVDAIKKAGASWPVIQHTNGIIAFQRNQLDQAQSSLQQVLSRYPDYSSSQLLLAMVNNRQGQYQNALVLLEQYLAKHPDEYRPNIIYADSLLKTGRAEPAIERLEQLNLKHPNDPQVLAMLSQVYQSQRKTDLALEYLERAIKFSPEQADLKLQLVSLLLGDPAKIEQGRKELQEVLKQNPENQKASQLLYLSYMRERKFAKAREVASRVEKLNPDSSLGLNMTALTYYSETKKPKAIEMLKKAMSQFPTDSLTTNNLARIYLQEGELGQAKSLYEELLKQDDSNLKVLIQLAMIAARQQKQEESLEWIRKAYDRNPSELSPKLLLASRYLQNEEASQAIDVLNTAGPEQRDTVAYIMLQAQAKLAVNEVQHAIRLLKKLISNHPRVPAAHFLLAQSYAKDQKPDRMRESLSRALKLNPEYLSAELALARLDLFEGKQEDFKTRVNLLKKRYPDNGAVLVLAAKLDSREQNYGQAIDKLSSLVEKTSHPEVVIDLSINQWKSGDRQGAISSLEFWTQEHQDDTRALLLLAQYYLAENQFEAARLAYKKIESYLPDQPVVLNNMAWTLKDVAPEEGLKYAERARQISPENPMILDTLGVLYLEIGDTAKALENLEKAAALAPNFIDIQINYAHVLVASNNKVKAKTVLSNLLSKASSADQRQKIKKELDKI